MKNLIALAVSAIALFTSCTKKKSTDTIKPIITVVEPSNVDTTSLSVEPEIHIEFTATDETSLSSISVNLYQNDSMNIYSNNSSDVKGLKVYDFHQHIVPTSISTTTSFKLILEAKDEGGNTQTEEIHFYIEP